MILINRSTSPILKLLLNPSKSITTSYVCVEYLNLPLNIYVVMLGVNLADIDLSHRLFSIAL